MSYSLYLDDIRTPETTFDRIVRSYEEAISCIKEYGMPKYISFDHDLGSDETSNELKNGYDFTKWLVESSLDGILEFPLDFEFNVHSANPIGRNNIQSLLNNYLHFKVVIEI